jgi:hypothetical protein
MTLLKDDGTVPTKTRRMIIEAWPDERLSTGIGLSIRDGWYLGIGFGLALTIAIPFILLIFSLFILVILAIFGSIG